MNRISLYDFVLDEIKGGRYYEPYHSDNENSEENYNGEKGMENNLKHMSYSNINQNTEENKHDFYKFLDDLFKTHTIPDNALEHMIYVPIFFEKIMSLSFLLCLDNILYDITFMPIQVIRSICILLYILLKNISNNFLNRFIDIKNFKFYKYATTCNFKYLKRYKARVIKNSNKFINTEMIRTGKKIKTNDSNDLNNKNLIYDYSYNLKNYTFDKFYGHHDIDGFTYKNVSISEDVIISGENDSINNSMENNLVLMKIKQGKTCGDELNTTCSHSDIENNNTSSLDILDNKNIGSSDEYHSNYSSSFYVPKVYCIDSEYSEKIYYKKNIRDALVKKNSLVNFNYAYSRSIGDGSSIDINRKGFGRKRKKKKNFKLYSINSFDKNVKKNRIFILIYFLFKPFNFVTKKLFNFFKYIVKYVYSFFLIIYMNIIHFFHIKKLYTFNYIKKEDKTKIITRSLEIKYLPSKQQTGDNVKNEKNNGNDDCVQVYKEHINPTQEMNNVSAQIKACDSDLQKPEFEKDEKDERKGKERNGEISYLENKVHESNVEKNQQIETEHTTNENEKAVNFTNIRNVANKYISNKKLNEKHNFKKRKEENDANCKDKNIIYEKSQENTKINNETKNEGFTMNEQNDDSYFYYTCNEHYSEKKKKNVKNVKYMKKKLLKDHINFLNLSFPEYSGLIRTSLILICIYIFSFLDTSRIYHYIRAQPFMKLYVVLNMLEILERLLRSLGKDLIDNMIRTFIRIINLRSYIYIIRNHYNNMTNDDENFSNESLEGRRKEKYIINNNSNNILQEEGNGKKKNEKIKFSEIFTKEYRTNSDIYINYKGINFKKNNKNNDNTNPYFNKEKNMFSFLKNNNEMPANFKLPIFYPFLSILIKFILQYIFVLIYILTHAFAHLIRFLSLNIAINSSEVSYIFFYHSFYRYVFLVINFGAIGP